LIKKNVTRRTFKSKKNPEANRQKAPKIQRLITDIRIRRKKIQKEEKVRRWKKTLEARVQYNKLIDEHVAKRKAASHDAKVARKDSKAVESTPVVATQPKQTTGAQVKATVVKTKKATK
jgi:small subunit ribosomal protein S6e